eukprot:403377561
MDFLSKQIARVGKSYENFEITFRPLLLKINVTKPAEYYILFKRGPQKNETKKYKLDKSGGLSTCDLAFDPSEQFQKVSSFYKEKDGTWQEKKAEIHVKCVGGSQEIICEYKLNLSSYIGRGQVKERAQLTGSAYHLDFEISVEEADAAKRTSVSQRVATENDSESENEETASPDNSSHSPSQIEKQQEAQRNNTHFNKSPSQTQQTSIFAPKATVIDLTPKINECQAKLMQEKQKGDQIHNLIAQLEQELAEQHQRSAQLQELQIELNIEAHSQKEHEDKLRTMCGDMEKEVEKLKKEVGGLYSFD